MEFKFHGPEKRIVFIGAHALVILFVIAHFQFPSVRVSVPRMISILCRFVHRVFVGCYECFRRLPSSPVQRAEQAVYSFGVVGFTNQVLLQVEWNAALASWLFRADLPSGEEVADI